MDSRLYIEWRESLGMWVVEYRGSAMWQHTVQADAEAWVKRNYPNHGYEIERVQVRKNWRMARDQASGDNRAMP